MQSTYVIVRDHPFLGSKPIKAFRSRNEAEKFIERIPNAQKDEILGGWNVFPNGDCYHDRHIAAFYTIEVV